MNALDQPQPLEQSIKDLCDLEFFNHFTDINTPGSIEFQNMNSIEPLFPLTDASAEREQPTPSPSPQASSYLQFCEADDHVIGSDIFSNSPNVDSGVVERLRYPRQSSTPRHEMPLSPALQDNSSILVEYYFKEVCGMMSCYDSKLNPYRTTISNLWGHSPSLYYVIQSMAAACLSEVSPGLSTAGDRLRDKAVNSLWNESRVGPTDTSSLLALVMLGFSLCWHDPGRLGQSEFELLAETVLSLENQNNNLSPADRQKRIFFHNSLVYWKMLLSFVTDQELPSLGATRAIQPQPARFPTQDETRMPHPQTGIGVEIQEIVAQVGALIRKERKRIRSRRHSSRHDIEQSLNAIRTAEELHSKLCEVELPKEVTVLDSGDDMTPTDHLLKAAEAYRCTGLLQLYRNFPDLLSHDIEPVNMMSQSSWLEAAQSTNVGHHDDAKAFLDTWLTSLALHVLDLVQEIPISSHSRSIQPLLLVSICSELSLNRSIIPKPDLKESPIASIISSPRMKGPPTITDVLHARRLIISRLSYFEGILAAKPIRQMLTLVKETWAWMDKKQQDVYWMDVMMENGYETLMG